MAFWSQVDFKEPLRANKWYIEFTSILKDVRFALKECKKPSYNVTTTKHRCFNYVVNLPGTITWEPITIKFASVRGDDSSKDASVLLYDLLLLGGSETPKTFLESTLSKTRMKNALESDLLNIIQVDPDGAPVEIWSLHNAIMNIANFGSLSYENENIVDIDCTITYDWAELNNEEVARKLGVSSTPPPVVEIPESEKPARVEVTPPETPEPAAAAPAETPPPTPEPAAAAPAETPPPTPEPAAAALAPIASADGITDPMSPAAPAPKPAEPPPEPAPVAKPKPAEPPPEPAPRKQTNSEYFDFDSATKEQYDREIEARKKAAEEAKKLVKTTDEKRLKALEEANKAAAAANSAAKTAADEGGIFGFGKKSDQQREAERKAAEAAKQDLRKADRNAKQAIDNYRRASEKESTIDMAVKFAEIAKKDKFPEQK